MNIINKGDARPVYQKLYKIGERNGKGRQKGRQTVLKVRIINIIKLSILSKAIYASSATSFKIPYIVHKNKKC